MGNGEPIVLRHTPNLVLAIIPERKENMIHHLLCQMIEHVGLILRRINSLSQMVGSIVRARDPRIMPCGNILCTKRPCFFQQPFKLNMAIARNTRIRCAPTRVLLRKIVNHQPLKRLGEVHHIVRNPQNICDTARIVHTRERTATAPIGVGVARLLRETHRHTDDFISLLLKQCSCNRAVHTSAHRDDNTLFLHPLPHHEIQSNVNLV